MIVDSDRRDFLRLAVETDASLTRLQTGDPLPIILVDLSASGCAFLSKVPLSAGETVEVRIDSPNGAIEPLLRQGSVIRVTPAGKTHRVALEFLPEAAAPPGGQ